MSETNGNGTTDPNASGMKRILSLQQGAAPKHALTRAQRAEVERIAYDLVIQECAKVHEHYLTQIPTFVARMVQDALLSYGLIVPQPGTDIAPVVASESPETPSGDTPPADSIPPAPTVVGHVTVDPNTLTDAVIRSGDPIPEGHVVLGDITAEQPVEVVRRPPAEPAA